MKKKVENKRFFGIVCVSGLILAFLVFYSLYMAFSSFSPVNTHGTEQYLRARDISISINSETFEIPKDAEVLVDSNSLSLNWYTGDTSRSLAFYFENNYKRWYVSKVVVSTQDASGIVNEGNITHFGSLEGAPLQKERHEFLRFLKSSDGKSSIRLVDYHLFYPVYKELPLAEQSGFSLGASDGNSTIVTGPESSEGAYGGHGANVTLRDIHGDIVKDQTGIEFVWTADNDDLVSVIADNRYCAEMSFFVDPVLPCPDFHAEIFGKKVGSARVKVEAIKMSTNEVIATMHFDVEVAEYIEEPGEFVN